MDNAKLEPFEQYPALASWIERLGSSGLNISLGDWGVFLGALNQALITAARRPALPDREAVARVIDLLLMDLLDVETRAGLTWSEKGGPSRVSLGVATEIIAMLSAAPKEGK